MRHTDPSGEFFGIDDLVFAAIIVGTITGTINVATHWDQIDGNFWKGAGAFGIGFGAGFIGTVTGGSAFAAAGGTALGAGGFLAGSIGAGMGYTYSTGFQGIGNNTLFGDPMPTGKELGMGLGFSMLTGGTLQGINAVANGRNFLTGNFKPVNIPQSFPVVKLEAPKIELNKDALTAKMESMPDAAVRLPQSQTFTRIETGDGNVVYQAFDKENIVRYVGITERTPTLRFAEHLNSIGTGKEFLNYRVIDGATGLTRTGARIWEQSLINQYGLQKNGGLLLNKINSIAPKNW